MGSRRHTNFFMYQYSQIRYCASLMMDLAVSKNVAHVITFNIMLKDIQFVF
jgi:hypothetical protein